MHRAHLKTGFTNFALIDRYYSLSKVTGVLALILRFVNIFVAKYLPRVELKCKKILSFKNRLPYSDNTERMYAFRLLIREEQQKWFQKEVESLTNDQLIDEKSVLKQYSPQLDKDGVL